MSSYLIILVSFLNKQWCILRGLQHPIIETDMKRILTTSKERLKT